jgi:hypothetical protein
LSIKIVKINNMIKYSDIVKEQTKDCVWIDDEHTRTTIWEKFEKIGLWFILFVFILCYEYI